MTYAKIYRYTENLNSFTSYENRIGLVANIIIHNLSR